MSYKQKCEYISESIKKYMDKQIEPIEIWNSCPNGELYHIDISYQVWKKYRDNKKNI